MNSSAKYVVVITDPNTGEVMVGDIPTSKSHAKRWANHYISEGYFADIIPAEEVSA